MPTMSHAPKEAARANGDVDEVGHSARVKGRGLVGLVCFGCAVLLLTMYFHS
jgi:hypothetical protein